MQAFTSQIAPGTRSRWAFRLLVGLLGLSAAAASAGPPLSSIDDRLLGLSCCFSRRAGLDVCSPNCPGSPCASCGYPHPARQHAPRHRGWAALGGLPRGDVWSGTEAELDSGLGPSELDEAAPPQDTGVEGVAASFGATARGADVMPNMVGDFFGGGIRVSVPSLTDNSGSSSTTVLPMGGGDRRFKLSENNSPFPSDRVFFNFHHFKNAIEDVNARQFSLDRYTFGIEKTFLDGRWSAELRIPFAYGLDSTQLANTSDLNSATEFGNIPLVVKRLLFRRDGWAAAAGVALTFPTAEDAVITDGESSLVVENEAYHLQPFLGLYYAPNDRLWAMGFAQADFDANGNTTTFSGPAFQDFSNPNPTGGRGVLQDQNALYLDLAISYWLYRDTCGSRLVSGIAPILELHYSTTMQDGDVVRAANGRDSVGSLTLTASDQPGAPVTTSRLDVLNLTAALRFQLGQRSMLTLAGVAPLRTGQNKLFDSELGVQYVWSY